ncbi:hypothetical protein L5B97_00510 [Avibacterium sp. 20-15]|uniref:hypothetical protein n=1 Tax=unclassified Avibacterium TaxID=2685287 RepID=UPI0020271189|nr:MULTISPECIES: hypothetical protein [unclassified Avibacterium]MCW9731982.1 hypothetical protein [Avibacterium sp. 20-15]URL05558.1 hypothetical protein L4F93_11590 [Avibacterium sp. 20-132]
MWQPLAVWFACFGEVYPRLAHEVGEFLGVLAVAVGTCGAVGVVHHKGNFCGVV